MVLEAEIPIADAVALPEGAEVRFFMNVEPTNPVEAKLSYVAYRAESTAEGVLAYRARASFTMSEEDAKRLRIGLCGTAKFYGERTAFGLYLLRKLLSVMRRWLGV